MRDYLQLFINGNQLRLADDWAFATLSEFLRGQRNLTGTKVVCAEGDCGACSVLVGRLTDDGAGFNYQTIDACIIFMHQLDKAHVVTVEGLSQPRLSAVQQAMIEEHGSQCGFCTPGFVVAIHGLCEHSCKSGSGQTVLTDTELRLGLSGNLCRCTGYVQILQAGRRIDLASVPALNEHFYAPPMIQALCELPDQPVQIKGTTQTLYLPRTIEEVVALKSRHDQARLVSGATDIGVWFNHGRPNASVIIDLGGVNELKTVSEETNGFKIGASVTWTKLIEAFRSPFPQFVDILERFGSPQIRNMGTVGGNLVNASPIADSIPFFMAMEATLLLRSVHGTRTVAIDDFYRGYKTIDLQLDEIVESIVCPKQLPTESLHLYKISKRRDMDISTLTAAIRLDLNGETITRARIAFGGVGPIVTRAQNAEDFLSGKPLTIDTMTAAGRIARDEVTPISDVRGSADYRRQLVENVFLKVYYEQIFAPEVAV